MRGGKKFHLPPILCILLGAGLGLTGGSAFAATVNCSHTVNFCQGTGDNDNIHGWENFNEINARNGRDNVWGYGSGDRVWGGEDGDALNGGTGNDIMFGELGNDSYLEISGTAGVFGQSEQDEMYGNVGRDFIEGNAAGDWFYGGDSADAMWAQDATYDYVNGGAGEPPYAQNCWVDGFDYYTACTPL